MNGAGQADVPPIKEGTTTSTDPKTRTILKAKIKCIKQVTTREDKTSIHTHSSRMNHIPTRPSTTKTGITVTRVAMTWKITTRARHAQTQNQPMSGQQHVLTLVEDAARVCIKLICDGEGRKIMHLVKK